jgi:AraC-like DNA-binding protein
MRAAGRRRRTDPATAARAHPAILADPRDHRSISQIAYQHGFVSNTHFSRAFRSAFGCSPSDARAGSLVPHTDAEHAGAAYDIWIRRLGA